VFDLYFAKLNFRNRFSKGRKELLPLWVKWDDKDGQELIETGDQLLSYFITVCWLQPNARVLDIGCGIGRMAVALTHYLTSEGGYDGTDINPGAIKWCTSKITRQYPRFCFHFADIDNKKYNPKGRVKASGYAFPFDKDLFDLVILISVFTHCSLKIWNTTSLRLHEC
jgi:SAM-dependent methyltransferase